MGPKRTPGQVWKQIVDEAKDDQEIEQLASMTDAELDAELAQAGFDAEQERAAARATREELEHRVAQERAREMERRARVRSMRPARARRPPVVVWFAAATVGVAAAGGLAYVLTHPAPPREPTPPVPSSAPAPQAPSPEDLIAAADLRRRAFADCEAQLWQACLSGLDEARRRDPPGDRSPAVQLARQGAEHALAVDGGDGKPQKAPDKPLLR